MSELHKIVEAWRSLWRLSNPMLLINSRSIRAGVWRLFPVGFWISPAMESLQPLCAASSSVWPPSQSLFLSWNTVFLFFDLYPLPLVLPLCTAAKSLAQFSLLGMESHHLFVHMKYWYTLRYLWDFSSSGTVWAKQSQPCQLPKWQVLQSASFVILTVLPWTWSTLLWWESSAGHSSPDVSPVLILGKDHMPWPAGNNPMIAARDAVGLLW